MNFAEELADLRRNLRGSQLIALQCDDDAREPFVALAVLALKLTTLQTFRMVYEDWSREQAVMEVY